MSPFVEPRFRPIGNTFLGLEGSCSAESGHSFGQPLGRLRRHSFSHVSYALAARTEEPWAMKEAGPPCNPLRHSSVAVEAATKFNLPAAVLADAAGDMAQKPPGESPGDVSPLSSTTTATPGGPGGSSSRRRRGGGRSSASSRGRPCSTLSLGSGSQELGLATEEALGGESGGTTAPPPVKRQLVQQLRCTGSSALARAALMVKDIKPALV